jgi:hypothetical protein
VRAGRIFRRRPDWRRPRTVHRRIPPCGGIGYPLPDGPHRAGRRPNHQAGGRLARHRSITFYQALGFELLTDVGFERGHPVIMRHAGGVVINLLGPSTAGAGHNVLMDEDDKYPGLTHVSFRVESLEAAEAVLAEP